VQNLGDLPHEVAAVHMAREEPQDDVLPLADHPVLPGRVMPHLAFRAVELLRVDLDDQPPVVAQVPDQVRPAEEASPSVEELPLKVVRRDTGVVASQTGIRLRRRLGPPVGQRQPGDRPQRALAVPKPTPDLRQVLRPDQSLVQGAVEARDRLVARQRRERLGECLLHVDHSAALDLDRLATGVGLPEDDPVTGLPRGGARKGRLWDDPTRQALHPVQHKGTCADRDRAPVGQQCGPRGSQPVHVVGMQPAPDVTRVEDAARHPSPRTAGNQVAAPGGPDAGGVALLGRHQATLKARQAHQLLWDGHPLRHAIIRSNDPA
jgi:hypothetical protein